MNIMIELNDAQARALAFVAVDPVEWANNVVIGRAMAAIDEIYALEVKRMQDDPAITAIPTDKEVVVLNSTLPSAADTAAKKMQQMLDEATKILPPSRIIQTSEFRAKFTDAQLAELWARSSANPVLSVFLMKAFTAPTIDLDSDEVKNGLNYLVSLGFAIDLDLF